MSSVEELQKQLEEERKLRLEAEAKVKMLEGDMEEWQSQMGKKLENLKQDLYKSHEEVITCQTTSKEELRDYMVQNLEMVETSLENKLKDTFKELLKEENMLAQSQEAIKQVILDAHEELYAAQKTNQQELQSFIMESMELVERGLENRLKETFDKEGSKLLNSSQQDFKEART